MARIRIGGRQFSLPGNRIARMAIGIALILGGLVGFLPILGFWMVPLGLVVLSVDFPIIRRWRRRFTVWFGDWAMKHFPNLAKRFGFNGQHARAHQRAARSKPEED